MRFRELRRCSSRALSFLLAMLMFSGALSGTVFANGVDGSNLSTEDTNAILDNYPNYVPDNNSCTDSGNTSPTGNSSSGTKSSISLPSGASIEQKIGQTLIVGFDAGTPKSVIEDVASKYNIGGIFITGTTDAAGDGFTASFFNKLNNKAGVDLMIASDEEGGQVQRFTYDDIKGGFPSAKQMGTLTPGSVKQIGQSVGSDLANDGVTVDLAPVLDLDDGKNIIASTDRSFGSDPGTVADNAEAFASGLELGGITPTYKHFPGFGGAGKGNTDTEPVTVPGSYDFGTNISIYKDALTNDNQANVMLSNLFVPNFNNGKVATSMSPDAVNYLRKTLNFNGLIMTDNLSAFDQASYRQAGKGMSVGAAVSSALQAGVDMPLFSLTVNDKATAEAAMDAIIKNVKANVPTKVIQDADTTVIAAKNSTPSTDQSGAATGGCCQGGGTAVTGKGAEVAIYNYFIGKGLSGAATAGIMGNFQAESAFNPERLQSTPVDQLTPAGSLSASQLSDGNLGWGIAQFTPPNTYIVNYAQKKNIDPNNLTNQLDFIWGIINNNGVADKLKATSTPSAAADVFVQDYERPADIPGTEPTREALAETIFKNFQGKTPLPPNAQGGSVTTTGGCGTSSASGIYQDPMRDVEKSSGFSAGRIDEGVDYTGSGPIYALGDAKVMLVDAGSGWPGGTFISYKLTDGPAQGDWVYIAENCQNIKVSVGDQVTSSSVLCSEHDAFPYIETGWAVSQAEDLAASYNDYTPTYPDGWSTAYGQNFSDLLASLGAPAGTHQFSQQSGGKDLSGTLPTGWPTW